MQQQHRKEKRCRECDVILIAEENTTQHAIDTGEYICRDCRRDYKHRTGRSRPMNEAKDSGVFLGCFVAENILSHIFKDVERMPYGNSGYDFICNRGKKIDVKSSCLCQWQDRTPTWIFSIHKNQIADYFLCLAFDNRKTLNPQHIWLIPGKAINHLVIKAISTTTISKWNKYELDKLGDVVSCCDIMKIDAERNGET